MKLELDIRRHCIETAARLKNEQLIRAALKGPDPDAETWIPALTWFLKHADFSVLRTAINGLNPPQDQAVLEWNNDDPADMILSAGEHPVRIILKN